MSENDQGQKKPFARVIHPGRRDDGDDNGGERTPVEIGCREGMMLCLGLALIIAVCFALYSFWPLCHNRDDEGVVAGAGGAQYTYTQLCFLKSHRGGDRLDEWGMIVAKSQSIGGIVDDVRRSEIPLEEPKQPYNEGWYCGEVYLAPGVRVELLTIYRDDRNPSFTEVWASKSPHSRLERIDCDDQMCEILLLHDAPVNTIQLVATDEPASAMEEFDSRARGRLP